MKAVVLARGLGTRMMAHDESAKLLSAQEAVAGTGVKSLVPIEGRPFLDYVLSGLADAGCDEMCLVIGPEHHVIRERYTAIVPPRRFRVAFAIQDKPQGTADAVLAAEAFANRGEFLVINSDNYYPLQALRALISLGRPGTILFTPSGLISHSNLEAARIRGFALAMLGEDGCLDGLVEKPDEKELRGRGAAPLISMNCWRFPSAIFTACRGLTASPRGEFEITDAVAGLIAAGHRLKVLTSDEGVLDLSRKGDIGPVVERLRGARVEL